MKHDKLIINGVTYIPSEDLYEKGKQAGFDAVLDWVNGYVTVEQGVVFEGAKLATLLETKRNEILK